MSWDDLTSAEWLFDSPQEILNHETDKSVRTPAIGWAGLSALFSYALAGSIWTGHPAIAAAGPSVSPNIEFLIRLGIDILGFLTFMIIVHRTVRWVKNQNVPWHPIFVSAMVASLPFHLLLPAALLCRPLGIGGLGIYAVVKLFIWLVVFRRWSAGLQNLYGWPAWGAGLLVFSPILLSAALMAFFSFAAAIVLLCVALGALG